MTKSLSKWDAIPHYPLGTIPDNLPEKDPILYRQVIAKRALIAAYEEPEEVPEESIRDALADLRHLCDALGLDFGSIDTQAYQAYQKEKGTEKRRR